MADDKRAALLAADELLGVVRERLDPDRDLLIVVAPTSPLFDGTVHFGIAVAEGPGFPEGSTLTSPATGDDGIVTLPDVAPTVLDHLGIDRPSSMLGRAWFAVDGVIENRIGPHSSSTRNDIHRSIRTPVATVFVLVQLALYSLTVCCYGGPNASRERDPSRDLGLGLEFERAVACCFPLGDLSRGRLEGHGLGGFPLAPASFFRIDVVLVVVAASSRAKGLERFCLVAAATVAVLSRTWSSVGPLQLNTVFSYSPIVAGRFSGIGNIAFAVSPPRDRPDGDADSRPLRALAVRH